MYYCMKKKTQNLNAWEKRKDGIKHGTKVPGIKVIGQTENDLKIAPVLATGAYFFIKFIILLR